MIRDVAQTDTVDELLAELQIVRLVTPEHSGLSRQPQLDKLPDIQGEIAR